MGIMFRVLNENFRGLPKLLILGSYVSFRGWEYKLWIIHSVPSLQALIL